VDAAAKAEVEWLIELTSKIRGGRTELNVPPSAKLKLIVETKEQKLPANVERNLSVLQRLARVSEAHWTAPIEVTVHGEGRATDNYEMRLLAQRGALQVLVEEVTYVIPLEGIIDIDAEKARLAKALEVSLKEAKSLEGRLNNPAFVEKAKPEAVEKARADHAHHAAEAERLAAALARLG
jgi:valyl-tRNA synthetase